MGVLIVLSSFALLSLEAEHREPPNAVEGSGSRLGVRACRIMHREALKAIPNRFSWMSLDISDVFSPAVLSTHHHTPYFSVPD